MFGISRMFLAVTRSLGLDGFNTYKDTVLDLNPVAYWRLGESSGTIAVDEIGSYDGTYVGTPTLGVDGLLINDSDTAVQFDGIDQAVSAVDTGFPATTTARAVVTLVKSATQKVLFTYGTNTSSNLIEIGTDAAGNIGININGSNIYYTSTIDDGILHHIVVSFPNVGTLNDIDFYVDGALLTAIESSLNPTTAYNTTLGGSAYISRTIAGTYYSQTSDDTVLFDTVLTQEQVTDLYNASISNFKNFDILIDHTKFDEDVYNFPVLINLDTTSGIEGFDTSAVFKELDRQDVDDDFTGTDGDAPDVELWEVGVIDPDISSYSIDIEGNKLKLYQTLNVVDGISYLKNNSIFKLSGDFDIQVDVSGMVKGSTYDKIYAMLLIDAFGYMSMYTDSSGNNSWVSNMGTRTLVSRTNTFGKLRVSRVGSTVSTYYIDGSGTIWGAALESSTETTEDVIVSLAMYLADDNLTGSASGNLFFDNFIVNSGTIVWPDNTLPTTKAVTTTYNQHSDLPEYAVEVMSLNPVAYWRLGEASGTEAKDETGNYHGTYVNTPTLGVAGLLTNDTDTAVTFNGSTQNVIVSDTGFPATTIARAVVTSIKSATQKVLFTYGTNTTSNLIEIGTDATGNIGININGSNIYYTSTIDNNILHHIVVSFPNAGTLNDIDFYVDGALLTSIESSSNPTTAYNTTLGGSAYISRTIAGTYYGQTSDDTVLFDTVLTQEQVTRLYNKSIDQQPDDASVISQHCKVEIDRWDQINSQAQLWVKVPYISKDVDTILNLSYDSTNADNSANIGITGSTPGKAVWSEYDAVYHLSKDGADSAANSLNGTLNGGIDATNIVDFGIGKGMTFDGVGEYIYCASATLFDITTLEDSTLEYCFKAFTAELAIIFETLDTGLAGDSGIAAYINATNVRSTVQNLTGTNTLASENAPYIINELRSITSVFDNSVADYTLYAEGTASTAGDQLLSGDMSDVIVASGSSIAMFGARYNNGTPTLFIDGVLKEIRFAKNLKTPGWIASNYDSTQDILVRYKNK